MEKELFVRAEEVARELGISKPYAYKLVREMNEELKKKGFLTIPGRVSRRYFEEKWLHLFRNEETLAWELERVETELWKAPPEPLLEQVSAFLSSGSKEWAGTPTELASILGVDMKPNALTRRLNVNAGRLLNEYGIRYESSRNRNERTVKLAATERS